jgi:2-polyprenyl-6-methoxyphenol hydroxylase-like FAD-dependent oxidoreductase
MSAPDIALKVAIVGAGISGISTYLFLKKHLSIPCQILIYETYPSLSRKQRELSGEKAIVREAATFIGGGFGVAPNGMRVIWELDPEIHHDIVAQGYPSLRFQIKNSHNQTLGSVPTADVYNNQAERLIVSTRQGFWDCLRERVPEEAIRTGKAVLKVGRGPNSKPILDFMDGTKSEEFDLIIGADGMRSVVRNAVRHGEHFEPIYEGVCSVGGFVSSDHLPRLPPDLALPPPQSPVVMTFGGEGFFGYGPCSSSTGSGLQPLTSSHIKENKVVPYGPQLMWWSTFSVDNPPKSTKITDTESIHAQLLKLHSKWQDPVIKKVLADPAISVMTAKFVTPKLPTWIGDHVVLIGDAAHTLPYTSGQGVSMALEDAQALAMLLAHYLQNQNPPPTTSKQKPPSPPIERQIQAAITTFQTIRKPRVERIIDFSRRTSNPKMKMGPVKEWITYFFMWVRCTLYTLFPGLLNRFMGSWDAIVEIRKAIQDQEKMEL